MSQSNENNNNNNNNLILQFSPPLRISINNNSFSLKDKLKNKNYAYRCMDRKNCSSSIHVNETELSNYLSNNFYSVNIIKTVKEHTSECEFF